MSPISATDLPTRDAAGVPLTTDPPMTHSPLPPRADDQPAPDTDTTPRDPDDELVSAIGPDLRDDATRIENYRGIAVEQFDDDARAAALVDFRGYMREQTIADPWEAAAQLAPNGSTARAIALQVWCAVQLREEGREDLARAPSIDSPGGDIRADTGKRKGRGKGKAKGPQGRRAVRWLGGLGRTVASYKLGFGPDNEALLDALNAGRFRWTPDQIRKDPVYGFCDLARPMDTDEFQALPGLGGDAEYVVWGLRCDSKASGCPSKRFQIQADAKAMQEAQAKGYAAPTPAAVKEFFDALRSDWYATATPTTTIVPVSFHRPTFRLTIHTGDQKAVDAAVKLLGASLGGVERVQSAVQAAPTKGLVPISLRHPDLLSDKREVNLGEDFLVWLVCRHPEALSTDTTGDLTSQASRRTVKLEDSTVVEWWPEDAVELVRAQVDADKRITVKVSGAPEEGGVLSAALATGAVPKKATIAIRHTDQQWRVTIEAGAGNAWKLPVLTKIGRGTPEELDACVDERLRLLAAGQAHLDAMMRAFLAARPGFSQLGQLYRQAIRADIGKQLELFVGLVPRGGQAKLGDVVVTQEKRTRGGRARAEA